MRYLCLRCDIYSSIRIHSTFWNSHLPGISYVHVETAPDRKSEVGSNTLFGPELKQDSAIKWHCLWRHIDLRGLETVDFFVPSKREILS